MALIENDFTVLQEQYNKILKILDSTHNLAEIEEAFKTDDISIKFDSFKNDLNDVSEKRIAIQNDPYYNDTVAGLIYTHSISKNLAGKLETANIKSLRDFKNYTLNDVKLMDGQSSRNRLFGLKSIFEICQLLITHNLGFKDKTPEELTIMLKHYNEFAS